MSTQAFSVLFLTTCMCIYNYLKTKSLIKKILSASPPLDPHDLVMQFGHWMQLSPERNHLAQLLPGSRSRSKEQRVRKIWDPDLTILGHDVSFFLLVVTLGQLGWCTLQS